MDGLNRVSLAYTQVGTFLRSFVPELVIGAEVADHLSMVVPYTG